ncbi:unnamed protein product [Arctogadus glacialis]
MAVSAYACVSGDSLVRVGLLTCSRETPDSLELCSSASHIPPQASHARLVPRDENDVRLLRESRACTQCSV